MLSGDHAPAREWALRLSLHPVQIDGILYPSRHDPSRENVALFGRDWFQPGAFDAEVGASAGFKWRRAKRHGKALIHGPPVRLDSHPAFFKALKELEVALLP